MRKPFKLYLRETVTRDYDVTIYADEDFDADGLSEAHLRQLVFDGAATGAGETHEHYEVTDWSGPLDS